MAVDGEHIVGHRREPKSVCCTARRDSTHPAQPRVLPGLGYGKTLLLRIHPTGRFADIPQAVLILCECLPVPVLCAIILDQCGRSD